MDDDAHEIIDDVGGKRIEAPRLVTDDQIAGAHSYLSSLIPTKKKSITIP